MLLERNYCLSLFRAGKGIAAEQIYGGVFQTFFPSGCPGDVKTDNGQLIKEPRIQGYKADTIT